MATGYNCIFMSEIELKGLLTYRVTDFSSLVSGLTLVVLLFWCCSCAAFVLDNDHNCLFVRADTNNSLSDRQDSDDDNSLDPEPTRLNFTSSEVTEDKSSSPHCKPSKPEQNTKRESTQMLPNRYFQLCHLMLGASQCFSSAGTNSRRYILVSPKTHHLFLGKHA